MERIANAVRDGEIDWSSDLRRDLGETIAGLRHLSPRQNWSTVRFAQRRARPLLPVGKTTPPSPSSAGAIFIALSHRPSQPISRTSLEPGRSRSSATSSIDCGASGHRGRRRLSPAWRSHRRSRTDLRERSGGVLREADTELLTAAGVFVASSGCVPQRFELGS
jgi:hypothetical protein